jgi:UDP-N-acetylmuramoylalanine--D-glutamate ligase
MLPLFHSSGTILRLIAATGDGAQGNEIANLSGIGTLRGQHNAQNALAALAAVKALQDRLDQQGARSGLPVVWRPPVLAAALRTYPGLPHRMEEVGRSDRVTFINDSKATNADSTEKALASWQGDIFWILGGKPKAGGIGALAGHFPRIAKAYLIGEAIEEFAATLEGKVPFQRCGTLDVAIAAASADAAASSAAEPVVLLSPACASFDHYRNFEVRGEAFRGLVAALPGIEMKRGAV